MLAPNDQNDAHAEWVESLIEGDGAHLDALRMNARLVLRAQEPDRERLFRRLYAASLDVAGRKVRRTQIAELFYAIADRSGLHDQIGAEAVAEIVGPANLGPLRTVPLELGDWFRRDIAEPDFILGNWLSTTTRVMFVAPTGLGKTNFALALGFAVAAGRGFLHWEGRRKARVLYIDGEMSRRLLKRRLHDASERLGEVPENFYALSHEDIDGFAPLNTPAGQQCIEAVLEILGDVDLIIFDSIMFLLIGDQKDELAWSQTLPWVKSLTRRAIGQIWLHHTGHDETRSYGSKAREWQLDTVIHAEAVQRDDTDVSFSLDFRKARERTPETRAEFTQVRVALVDDQWQHDGEGVKRAGHIAPACGKFLDALQNALASPEAQTQHGRKAATLDQWRAECTRLGLIDPDKKPGSARTLLSRHRTALIAANRIACEGELSWTL